MLLFSPDSSVIIFRTPIIKQLAYISSYIYILLPICKTETCVTVYTSSPQISSARDMFGWFKTVLSILGWMGHLIPSWQLLGWLNPGPKVLSTCACSVHQKYWITGEKWEGRSKKTSQRCEQAKACPWGGLKNRMGSDRGERVIWACSRIRFVIFFYSRWKFRELIPSPGANQLQKKPWDNL